MDARINKLQFPEIGGLGAEKGLYQEPGDQMVENSFNQQEAEPAGGKQEESATSPQPQNEAVTLAARTQALFQEALLSGNIDQFLALLQSWIEKLRQFLNYSEVGITTTNNILTVTKTTLQTDLGIQPDAAASMPAGMALPTSSLQLVWNLIRTPEFQTLTGRMLAQALKMNFGPPIPPR